MRIVFKALAAAALLSAAAPAFAQEMVVTGSRRDANQGYVNGVIATGRPIVTLRRTADYAVQTVRVVGDTRDSEKRRTEVRATVRNAIEAAGKAGVELSVGDYVLEPLTLANYATLPMSGDGRADTDQTFFLAKVRLGPGVDDKAALARIAAFVAAVRREGRTTIQADGGLSLSVVNPDQYRKQIIKLIAADAASSATEFGAGYGVEVTGLDRPVEWTRASQTDVFLYLPAAYKVVPKN
ncbi:MAG: TonB-dependent receptor [Pseudomonadota bacterium]